MSLGRFLGVLSRVVVGTSMRVGGSVSDLLDVPALPAC